MNLSDLNHEGRQFAILTASLDCDNWGQARDLGHCAAEAGVFSNPFDRIHDAEQFYGFELGVQEQLDELITTALPRVASIGSSGTTALDRPTRRERAIEGVGLAALALLSFGVIWQLPY